MSDNPTPYESAVAPKEKSGCGKPVLFGCLGVVALLFIVAGGITYWFMTSGRAYLTDSTRNAIVTQIQASDLPPAQQQALEAEVDRVALAFKEGEISLKEMAVILDELAQSPIMSTLKIYGVEGNPIASSGLSPEEKEQAMLTLQRFAYGVFEERIPASAVNEIIDPLLVDPDGAEEIRFRSDITEAELKAALEQAKAKADEAGIPTTGLEPDLARELQQIINRVLNRAAEPAN